MTGLDLHCSAQTKALGERLAGSASAAERFLLVELPLPWPSKIESHEVLAAVTLAPGTRVQGIRPADEQTKSTDSRIISYRRRYDEFGAFARFERTEASVLNNELAATLGAIATGDDGPLQGNDSSTTDVLVCTHGSRDRCCGSLGSQLLLELAASVGPTVRLWKTSHTGGHRFAPTAITFPDGLTWGFIDATTMQSVLDRSGEPHSLVPHLRGCAGFDDRGAQVADAAAFGEAGWSWLDSPRTVSALGTAATGHVTASGSDVSYRVDLREIDSVPTPICTEPIEIAAKATRQLVVEQLTTL
jgi:hypothetical protein|nr:hypothetical protein [Actinomycetota bacterium]